MYPVLYFIDRFETCWPVFSKNVNGVIVVAPQTVRLESDVDRW